MPDLVFGDNHLFGINHLSLAKAEAYRQSYADDQSIAGVFRMLRDVGIKEQMISAHLRARTVCQLALGEHPNLVIHPVIPYAHAINDEAASRGIVRTAFNMLRPDVRDMISMTASLLIPGGIVKFPRSSIRRFIENQIRIFGEIPNQNRGTLFLNNVFTDLLIGLGLYEWFEEYPALVGEFGYKAGFITYNPQFFSALELGDVSLCVNHNYVGYLTNIDSAGLSQLAAKYSVWAMGVFGSGAYDEDSVVENLRGQDFSKLVYATSRHNRLERMSRLIGASKAD